MSDLAAVSAYWLLFAKGLGTTIWISWLALLIGSVVGGILAHLRLVPARPVRAVVTGYVELFRSIPPLMLFFGSYYGVSYAFGLNLSPFVAATVALSLHASSMMSEVIRGGLQSVDAGQWAAGRASGMTNLQILSLVVWPQSFRVALPPAVGVYIATLKDTAVASVIGYVELTRSGLIVRENTGSSFLVFVIIAAMYFVVCYAISQLGAYWERRFRIVGHQ